MSVGKDMLTPLSKEQRPFFKWLEAPHLKKVIDALEAAEKGSARFVGGCVRDSLLGVEPKDFDIATTLEPNEVVDALKKAKLRSAPTGIEHGTVTAIVDHQGVEVTTLRSDVSTDGRRATVAFTDSWTKDSERRDFRINAIYLTPDGKLFDPVAGVADTETKSVCFIGDAHQRIREDYLRILRFFRFTARFSDSYDESGLAACIDLKEGIATLSAERIGAELMAISSLPRAAFAFDAMSGAGVLETVWPERINVAAIERLKSVMPNAGGPLVLAAGYGEQGDGIGGRLRLSNAEKSIRSSALKAAKEIDASLSEKDTRVRIYRFGKDGFGDGAAIAYAFGQISAEDHARLSTIAEQWDPPAFRITGRHVLALGIGPGPAVTKLLDAVEAQWIAEDFPDGDRPDVILSQQVKAQSDS